MGFALDWRELPERKASRIIVEKDVKFDDQNAWPQQFEYIMDVCMKMKKAFKKYLSEGDITECCRKREKGLLKMQ